MAYLDPIELDAGERLPPRYLIVKAGPRDSKIAVVPRAFINTYGRFDHRDDAIKSAWANFGWTPKQWDKIRKAVDTAQESDCRKRPPCLPKGHPKYDAGDDRCRSCLEYDTLAETL